MDLGESRKLDSFRAIITVANFKCADRIRGNNWSSIKDRAELDSGIVDSGVIVADTLGGAPLPAQQGHFSLIAPREKRAARWVRMLKVITVVRVPAS